MITSEELERIVRRHLETGKGGEEELLHQRDRDRGGLARLRTDSGDQIIVKIWHTRGFKARLKRALKLSNGWREWRVHSSVFAAGVPTPRPLGYCRFDSSAGRFEAMGIEDLGSTTRALFHLKNLIAEGAEDQVTRLEETLIQFTGKMVNMGLVDVDHQLNNFLIDSQGATYRVDFECARPRPASRGTRLFAEMLARLIASHVYAVQPDTRRTVEFARRLYAALQIDAPIRAMIAASVQLKMDHQRAEHGVNSEVSLPL